MSKRSHTNDTQVVCCLAHFGRSSHCRCLSISLFTIDFDDFDKHLYIVLAFVFGFLFGVCAEAAVFYVTIYVIEFVCISVSPETHVDL